MLFQTISTIIWTFSHRVEFDKIVPMVLFTTNTFALYCFLKLGTKWPNLMQKWHTLENRQPSSTAASNDHLAYKVKLISFLTLGVALSEY